MLEGLTTRGSARPVQTELELIEQAQQGDRGAFGELVRRHRQGTINVVYRMCGDAHLAEEAAQEAFIRAWTHLPRYKPQSPFRNWLYRIATNVAVDALRSEKETVDLESVYLTDAREGPPEIAETQERGERVREAVLGLPPASRAVIVLREYEGLSYREIADTLGIPMGTVMSRLNYARGLLRESLAPYMEGV
ncbi:MAG TPA: sigma-70 family RNA polymerase sigma factor [Chloroflexi bacterium]|nr:sigma-70 family RNA polymerase sigma factor [Chloroflexota bacterium]